MSEETQAQYDNSPLVKKLRASKRIWMEDDAFPPGAEWPGQAFERLVGCKKGQPLSSEDHGDHILQEYPGGIIVCVSYRGNNSIHKIDG